MPIIVDGEFIKAVPAELLRHAAEIREAFAGSPERMVQREIRDHLDTEKLRGGEIQAGGVNLLLHEIRMASDY